MPSVRMSVGRLKVVGRGGGVGLVVAAAAAVDAEGASVGTGRDAITGDGAAADPTGLAAQPAATDEMSANAASQRGPGRRTPAIADSPSAAGARSPAKAASISMGSRHVYS